MAPTQLVAFLFSFCLTVTKGSEVKQLFVQTGSDVTLEIMDRDALKDYIVLQWKFKNSELLLSALKDGTVTAIKERVVYHPQNSSLTVKNLQEDHSGLYQAGITANSVHPPIATYSITVQAPVSPVNLRVDSVSNSSESCNVTVSCTTESSSISINASITCDRHTCEEPRPLTPDPGPSLHLNLFNGSVTCNHSNHVSWKKDTKNILEVCQQPDPQEETNGTETDLATVVGVPVGILSVFLVLTGALLYRKSKKGGGIDVGDTVYADPQGPSAQPAPATEMMENPTSTYSLVGLHSGPGPAPTRAPAQSPPESLYATVNKPQSNPYTLTA